MHNNQDALLILNAIKVFVVCEIFIAACEPYAFSFYFNKIEIRGKGVLKNDQSNQ